MMVMGVYMYHFGKAFSHSAPYKDMITEPIETETKVINRNPVSKIGSIIMISLNLRINGYAKAFERQGLQYYFFNCNKHGRVVSYPQGYNEILVCTMCNSQTKGSNLWNCKVST